MGEPRTILVVEDSDEDFTALTRVMRQLRYAHPIYRAIDGDDALAYLYHQGVYANTEFTPTPDLILLDLNLPGTDGREVIQQVKQDTILRSIPIIVLTSSSNPKDVQTSYLYGANSYLLKPVGIDAFKQTIQHFIHYWLEVSLLL
ncbi:Response regulator rcp1 [Planktothrix serta PCC 8927]|uniref:Response regulator rcp1 n=1 Tax=Planktothrix serta PCC 8927 TaxID=671068 RepID=A0A7Z9DY84_9CYAN|nr:response regulator [Planktothrix serta]VXD15473.1 Response regulator rcp1 [Planktothrix serta PCC 8927]